MKKNKKTVMTSLLAGSLMIFMGCTSQDYTPEDQKAHEAMIENAAEAERAEAMIASDSQRKPASVRGSVYVVQVGAFKVKENAEKLQSKLKDAGFSVEVRSVAHSKNGHLHLVRLSPTANKAEAETMVDELKARQDDLHAQILRVKTSSTN